MNANAPLSPRPLLASPPHVPSPKPERLLRLAEVEQRTGLRKSTIYARMRLQPAQFPPCVAIGCRSVAWRESEIDAWIAALPERSAQR